MPKSHVSFEEIQKFSLWEKMKTGKNWLSFDLEITARCNLNCRHCYINLPAGDRKAQSQEMTLGEIDRLADEAASLGVLWCLITGGEPLVRRDFREIYLTLKRKGMLLSVFTNATLIDQGHIELFKRYPPRNLEVSVYGATEDTYEKISRRPGSFSAFLRGVRLLVDNGIPVRFKATVMRSNVHELTLISEFCRKITKDYYRFDPLLHLRFDGNPQRNAEIVSERLSPEEIVRAERSDPERFASLTEGCDTLIVPEFRHLGCSHLFHCGAGRGSFSVGYDGTFRLCSSLWHPDCVYDLRKGSLHQACLELVPRVRELRSEREEFLEGCRRCEIVNLCLWCPAHSFLETGELDSVVDYFCQVAHARAAALRKEKEK
jgi:radical SAM protein with 4Fe4S-binding SPASM domain